MALNKTSLLTAALVAALPFLADIFVLGTTDRAANILEEPGILIFNAGFAASPFILIGLIMAARKSVTRALWIGFALTVLLWVSYAGAGWSYHTYEKGGTLSIVLFMLMMVWPFIVTILMGLIGRFEPDRVAE